MAKKKATKKKVSRVPLTRAHGTMSEARFWAFVRSNLRRMTMRWPPKFASKHLARRKNQSDNKRLKWEYQCALCKGWFPDKETQVDHIVPCGSLKSFSDAAGFLERMLCEVEGFRVLCNKCHNRITHKAGWSIEDTLTKTVRRKLTHGDKDDDPLPTG